MRAAQSRARSRSQFGPRAAAAPGRGTFVIGRGTIVGIGLALALVAAWAAAATWSALDGKRRVERLLAEQAEMRQAHDEKTRALVRRLVGVASHQILEQDGLEGRMADLIARQVQLENRQEILAVLVDQIGVPGPGIERGASDQPSPAAASPAKAGAGEAPAPKPRTRSAEPAAPVPTLRLGVPQPPPAEGPGAQGPAISPLGPAEQRPKPQSRLSLRERFADLERSMDRVDRSQVRSLDGLARLSQNRVQLVRSTLSELGLDPDRIPAAKPEGGVGGPLIPLAPGAARGPFDAGVQRVEASLAQLGRLRPVIDALPFRRPLEGDDNLSSNFGPRIDPFTGGSAMHGGVDFRAEEGSPVRATGAGRVVSAEAAGGYGNMVEIDHGYGITTRYAHLSSLAVTSGQSIAVGAVVGLVGSTGRSTGPHLHYETRTDGIAVDPARFLSAGAKLLAATAPGAARFHP